MKTKDLIKALQEADPSGEIECTVENGSIVTVYTDAAYWDGRMQILEQGKDWRWKGKVTERGKKVIIRSMTVIDAVVDYPDMSVEYEIGNPEELERWQKIIEKIRVKSKEIERNAEFELFKRYVIDTASKETMEGIDDEKIVKEVAEEFFIANLFQKDKIPQDILDHRITEYRGDKKHEIIPSYNDMRRTQWEREIDVFYQDGKLTIKKKPAIIKV